MPTPRPSLLALADRFSGVLLAVVTAPAGSGKTTSSRRVAGARLRVDRGIQPEQDVVAKHSQRSSQRARSSQLSGPAFR
jgi:hypothetical protein